MQDCRSFFLVWSPTGPFPPKYIHRSFESAEVEAQRLARLHRGQKFVVLESRVSYEATDLAKTNYAPFSDFADDTGIPF